MLRIALRRDLRRAGFSLVELLVVMTIIAVLAGLMTGAAFLVLGKGKESKIVAEIGSLDMAVKSYKEKYGSYPPDFQNPDPNIIVRHFAKAFPRSVDTLPSPSSLTAAEALVLCLGGYSTDTAHPLTGIGGPCDTTGGYFNNAFFSFDKTRLVATRTINVGGAVLQLYTYNPADCLGTPYVYFSSTSYINIQNANQVPIFDFTAQSTSNGSPNMARPYWAPNTNPSAFVNNTSFQIICAGLDGNFGTTARGTQVFFPIAPNGTNTSTNFSDEDNDNLTNFFTGPLKDGLQ